MYSDRYVDFSSSTSYTASSSNKNLNNKTTMSNDSKTQKIPTTGFNNSSDLRRRQSTISSVSDSAKMSSSSLASGAYAVQSPQPQSSKMPVNNYPILSYKNKLLCDLTRAIQMVFKRFYYSNLDNLVINLLTLGSKIIS